jgi:lysophospholipase L1-like esterase
VNRKRALGLLFLLLSFLLSTLVAEAGLRLVSRNWLRILDVEMWRYARSVKKVSHLPGVVEEHQPNASAFLMGARVRTDERGFRLPDPDTVAARRPGGRTVVALGDSLTFGWGVPEGQTYADQLERLLPQRCPGGSPAIVHNAGIGNTNTSMQLARYRELIRPAVRPDWLILGLFINDAEPDVVPSESWLVWRSALAGLLSTRLQQTRESHLRDYRQYYSGLYEEGRPGWERQKEAIRELGRTLRAEGVPATAILLPELHEPRGFGGFAEVYSRIAKVARESGFEVIDPSGAFPPGPGDGFWVSRTDAHPDAAAQRIFAEALTRSRWACAPARSSR